MLICIEAGCTNIVICRHKNLLFARTIPIGTKQLNINEMITRLVLELSSCRQQFFSIYKKAQIERLIFFSGNVVDKEICTTIAKQMEIPAQMGDCMAAVDVADHTATGTDRRNSQLSWAIALGLSSWELT